MSTGQRRHFSNEQKVAIVKRHLVDKVSVSDLCDEFKILPTQFYQWQKQLFENGAVAFNRNGQSKRIADAKDLKITQLEAKIVQKNEVVAELLEDHVKLKKELGDL